MTTFQHRNYDKLNKLAKQVFGEGGTISSCIERNDTVDGYKYLLAYCIVSGKKINKAACETVKKASVRLCDGLRNSVFFEKAEDRRDFMYFAEYMKELEANAGFLEVWNALQKTLAA